MTKFPSRRTLLAGVTAALVSLLPISASGAAAETLSPVGHWSATVQTTIPSGGQVQYQINADHTIDVISGGVTTSGLWFQTSQNTFFFEITTPLKDSAGNVTGIFFAVQNSTMQDANNFTASGTTRDFNLQGEIIKTFQVQITATRLS